MTFIEMYMSKSGRIFDHLGEYDYYIVMNSKKLKWRTDFDKEVVIENFIRRGWTKADKDEEDWNFYWATVWTVRNLFNPKSGIPRFT